MRKTSIYASTALIILALTGAASAESPSSSRHENTIEQRSGAPVQNSAGVQKSATPSNEVGDHSSSYDSRRGYDSDDAH